MRPWVGMFRVLGTGLTGRGRWRVHQVQRSPRIPSSTPMHLCPSSAAISRSKHAIEWLSCSMPGSDTLILWGGFQVERSSLHQGLHFLPRPHVLKKLPPFLETLTAGQSSWFLSADPGGTSWDNTKQIEFLSHTGALKQENH